TGTPKTTYGFSGNPRAVSNDSTTFVGFQIDQISQDVQDGAMSFRLQFGQPTVVRALDTLAKVKVDGTNYGRYANLVPDATPLTIDMDSPQIVSGGRRQYTWVSWSDG